jgi:epoxyqueuosine reductase
LGNGPAELQVVAALQARLSHPSGLVREHVRWALERPRSAVAGPNAVVTW